MVYVIVVGSWISYMNLLFIKIIQNTPLRFIISMYKKNQFIYLFEEIGSCLPKSSFFRQCLFLEHLRITQKLFFDVLCAWVQ